jgi:hypothetical protein
MIACRKKVLAAISGPKREEVTKDGDSSISRSFVIYTIPQM